MQQETEIEVCYRTTLGDSMVDDVGEQTIQNFVDEHIQEFCDLHKIERQNVEVIEDDGKYLLDKLINAQERLIAHLSTLPNWSKECNCKGTDETIKLIHQGDVDEINHFCIECGGYL